MCVQVSSYQQRWNNLLRGDTHLDRDDDENDEVKDIEKRLPIHERLQQKLEEELEEKHDRHEDPLRRRMGFYPKYPTK